MSSLRVEEIALDAGERRQVAALINRSFPENPPIDEARVLLNTGVSEPEPSIYVAAKAGDEIIGFNAFIAHRLWLNGSSLVAFQSCWTATSSEHRGKGIFQQLINAGREIARSRGAGFLFGFPNRNSEPIFVRKLGFRECRSLKWQMPLLPLANRRWLNFDATLNTASSFLQDDRTLIDLKRRTHGAALLEIRAGGSMIWGLRRRARRFGAPLPIFEIGGMELEGVHDLAPLFNRLRSQARCVAAQFLAVEGTHYAPLFPGMKAVEPPFIVDDLNMTTEGLDFSFFSGIRDYY
jgi:GNAT superfamily N-acetyltransferase